MSLKARAVYLSTALVVVLLLALSCRREVMPPTQATAPLKPDETTRVVIQKNHAFVITKKGTHGTYLPPSGTVTTSVKKDGRVEVTIKNKGFDPQVGGGMIYADTFRASLDTQLWYWGRISTHAGLGIGKAPVLIPFAAVGYRLDQLRLANSSVGVGLSVRKDLVLMFRVEF